MKKILLFVVLIVGCDESSLTESSVHPLVGVWETTEFTVTQENLSQTVTLDETMSITLIFGEDKIFSVTSTINGETTAVSHTWSATENKLTTIDNADGETEVNDYSISGNILTITFEEIEDGVTTTTEFKCEKQ